MRLLLIIFSVIAVVIVVGSFYVDYKWRQWIAARKSQRQGPVVGDPDRRDREHHQ